MPGLPPRLAALFGKGGSIGKVLEDFFEALYVVRGCVLAAVFGFLALSLPDQTTEIYRILALDLGQDNGGWRVLAAFLALGLASVTLWYVGRRVTRDHPGVKNEMREHTLRGATLRWLPRVCGVALPAGLALGLYRAGRQRAPDLLSSDLSLLHGRLRLAIVVCLAIGGLLLAFTIFRHRLQRGVASPSRESRYRGLFPAWVDVGCLLFALLCIAIIWLWPVSVPQVVGSLPPLFLFIVLLVVGLNALCNAEAQLRIPVTWMALGLALTASSLDWNNHHRLETQPRKTAGLPAVDDAFRLWHAARVDRDAYQARGEPYPVFIVAAPGGGLYAAQFTATVLARLQDLCPRFAHHVFAISGVSGGALGAAVFASLAKGTPRELVASNRCDMTQLSAPPRSFSAGATHEAAVSELMARDFMAPVSATALFLDVPQLLVPVPLFPFDRATALERAFALAWDDVASRTRRLIASDNAFEAPFLAHWDSKGSAPALLLNATEVSQGHRVVISPFDFGLRQSDTLLMRRMLSFHKMLDADDPAGPARDVSLATAVGLSARFPWVMPAAPLGDLRILDGAVFENSGIDTAMDLIAELRRYDVDLGGADRARLPPGSPRIRITLIAIHNFDDLQPREGRAPSRLMAPVQALLSTRAARASFALSRADDTLCRERGDSCILPAGAHRTRAERPIVPIYLDHVDNAFTLGWHLSRNTRAQIERQASAPAACRLDEPPPAPRSDPASRQRVLVHNGCSACFVLARLAPDPKAGLQRCEQGAAGIARRAPEPIPLRASAGGPGPE